ncbi:MAG: hypothetical protein M3Y59_21965 [Myxococcota bacterium]|nr:hypothetical protein [Myxococcota bacterium]
MRRLFLILLLGGPALASAPSAPVVSSPPGLWLIAGSETIGAGWTLRQHQAFAELQFAPQHAYLDTRFGRSWHWIQGGVFGLSAHAAGSATVTTRGPIDAGLGLHGGVVAGARLSWLELHLSLQAGGELFARGFAARAPLRLGLGVAVPIRLSRIALRLGLGGRAGADLSPSLAPTVRYEGLVWLGLGSVDPGRLNPPAKNFRR